MGHLKSSKVCLKSPCADVPAIEPPSAALLEDKERRQRFSETTGDPRKNGRHAGFYDTGSPSDEVSSLTTLPANSRKQRKTAPLLDNGNAHAPPDASLRTATRNGRTAEKANIGRTKAEKARFSKLKVYQYAECIPDPNTVIFEPFDTGVLRRSEVVLPEDNPVLFRWQPCRFFH